MEKLWIRARKIVSNYPIVLILIVSFLNGLVYVRMVPPWEHYDEPAHFEYSWLIAHRQKLPAAGDHDQELRLAIGRSLIDSRFFEHRGVEQPNLTDPSKPLWIGVDQFEDPPLYYILTAIPIYLFQGFPVHWQLYLARIVSLFFLLLTIYAAFQIMCIFTPPGHPLRWLVPSFLAFLPGFVEFMTSMSDFTAAIGLASLWLLCAARLIQFKWSLKQALLLVILTIACVFTQKILYVLVPIVPFVLLLSVLPARKEWIGWTAALVAGVSAMLLVFQWDDAALWLRHNDQVFPTHTNLQAHTGFQHALQAKVDPDSLWENPNPASKPGFFQLVPWEEGQQLQGKQVTIAAWVWADQAMPGYGPGVNALYQFEDQWLGFQPVSLTTQPQYVTSVVTLPQKFDRVQIWLRTTSPNAPGARIYFGNVVLVEGNHKAALPPTLEEGGAQVTWAGQQGQPFTNFARNAHFGQTWPYLRPEVARLLSKAGGLNPPIISGFIALFGDAPGTGWYWSGTLDRIFETFWAVFGWGSIRLTPLAWLPDPYSVLKVLTILGFLSGLISIFWLYNPPRKGMIFLILTLAAMGMVAFFYGVFTMGGALRTRAYLPVARYIFPAIVPIALLLVTGWYGVVRIITKSLRIGPKGFAMAGMLLLVLLDVYSLYSIWLYARL